MIRCLFRARMVEERMIFQFAIFARIPDESFNLEASWLSVTVVRRVDLGISDLRFNSGHGNFSSDQDLRQLTSQ